MIGFATSKFKITDLINELPYTCVKNISLTIVSSGMKS